MVAVTAGDSFRAVSPQRYEMRPGVREDHDRLLGEVVEASPYADGLTLSNVMAQEEAERLLAEADDYF